MQINKECILKMLCKPLYPSVSQVRFPAGSGDVFLALTSRLALRPSLPPVHFLVGGKHSKHEDVYSPHLMPKSGKRGALPPRPM
jgi:hypothetical protein